MTKRMLDNINDKFGKTILKCCFVCQHIDNSERVETGNPRGPVSCRYHEAYIIDNPEISVFEINDYLESHCCKNGFLSNENSGFCIIM